MYPGLSEPLTAGQKYEYAADHIAVSTSGHVTRDKRVHEFLMKQLPSFWKQLFLVVLIFGAMAYDQVSSVQSSLTNAQVQCCSLQKAQVGGASTVHSWYGSHGVSWQNAENTADCTLAVCFETKFYDNNDESLAYDLTTSEIGTVALTVLTFMLVLIVCLLEYIYLVVNRDAAGCVMLLGYGLYVKMNKAKYYMTFGLLIVLICLYCGLKILVFSIAGEDISEEVNGKTVYLSFGDDIARLSWPSLGRTLLLFAFAFQGFFVRYYNMIHNFYSDISSKALFKEPSLIPFFAQLKKVELTTVEECMKQTQGGQADIGRLAKWDEDKVDALVTAIVAGPGNLAQITPRSQ